MRAQSSPIANLSAICALAATLTVIGCSSDDGGSGAGAGDVQSEAGTIDVKDDDSAADTTTADTGAADTGATDSGNADTGNADTGSGDTTVGDAVVGDATVGDGGSADATSCPAEAPIGTSTSCSEGTSCSYGQECCCGECFPAIVCSCSGGTFGCYYTDACFKPADACGSDAAASDASSTDAGGKDTAGGFGDVGAVCNEVMSSVMPCKAGLYCKRDVGQCTGMGTCQTKPDICTQEYAPVCGCDGKTYGNACTAAGNGANVASKGECGGSGGDLKWFSTCGDPVCKGWSAKDGVPDCSADQKQGGDCGTDGATCDPHSECNALLKCTDKDPKQSPGGCPISRASFKTAIDYVDAAEAAALARRLLAVKLATYRYKTQGPGGRRHLGFIIDDDPSSPAVDSRRDMVDLYGYLSMAVATLQAQQTRIDALEARLRALEAPTPKR